MPRTSTPRLPSRAVFISHAVADAEIVNDFVDTVLIKGIGISHEHIFNVSAKTSPLRAGGNFSPEIRTALRAAKAVIAIVTPTYFERPFTMAELGAAWAADSLIPILVPPVDFSSVEGVLVGVQCIRITDRVRMSELFDRFDRDDLNEDRWFTRAGVATFGQHLDAFMQGLESRLKRVVSPPTPVAVKPPVAQPAPVPKFAPPTLEDELAEFDRRMVALRAALGAVPQPVRAAFMYEVRDEWAIATEDQTEELNALEYKGLIKFTKNKEIVNGKWVSTRLFRPTKTSQRARDVYACIQELSVFLRNASQQFHLHYEGKAEHAAELKLLPFWDDNGLID
jgi:hypothetical protein